MDEFKKGDLKRSSGDKVKNRKQAAAIGISEAREEGLKVPKKKDWHKPYARLPLFDFQFR